uniref:Uncharacterized protein n=1 Tax=Arundo donax TaxID=35708 RepID=A0A0A9A5C1_ARUDO
MLLSKGVLYSYFLFIFNHLAIFACIDF